MMKRQRDASSKSTVRAEARTVYGYRFLSMTPDDEESKTHSRISRTAEEASPLFVNADLLSKLAIRTLACGQSHTLLLTTEGLVYSMGSNENGKLGVGRGFHEMQQATAPVKVDTLSNVAAIAVGAEHSLALTRDFRVYGWGLAEHGAIGMRLSNAKVPNEIKIMPEHQKVKFAAPDDKNPHQNVLSSVLVKEISCGL